MFRYFNVLVLYFVMLNYLNAKEFNIYLDADFSHSKESSISIKRGLTLGLKKLSNKWNINIIEANHRGNTKRSKKNIKSFLRDERALFMVSGIHSPPMLANKKFINQNKVLFFVPWAAAGPITRSQGDENWIYRLSIDDSKAGDYLAKYAVHEGYKNPCLLLENTGWGKSNHKGMTKGFNKRKINVIETFWFKWGIQSEQVKEITEKANSKKCDVMMLVANVQEGALFVKSFSVRSKIPIISHWGITGGKFHLLTTPEERDNVNLRFIQTKFNFISSKSNKFQKQVFQNAKSKYSDIDSPEDIKSSIGFIHAYDLGVLISHSLNKISDNLPTVEIRKALKKKIENIKKPVQGLLKVYKKPFSKFSTSNVDAHEALTPDDYAIGKFTNRGSVLNIN